MSTADRDLAVRCVADACRVARAVQRDLASVQEVLKDDRSPVTVADYAVQAIVALALAEGDADTPMVGEEDADGLRGPERRPLLEQVLAAVQRVRPDATAEMVLAAIDRGDHDATGDRFWTLDPVDGTKGFLRNQQYAIALALIDGGRPTVGVLGCPNLSSSPDDPADEVSSTGSLFAATLGGGTLLFPAADPDADPQPVHASAGPAEADATAATAANDPAARPPIRICESVEKAHSNQSDAARIVAELGGDPTPVRLDSQCKYAVVARGQADAYLRLPTRPGYVERIWDHAAGMLVASEAGARVSDVTGRPLEFTHGRGLEANRGVVCARADVHPGIITAIERLGLATSG